MGIVRGRKSLRISRIWKHLQMFSCTFYLGWNFYVWDCLNRKSFLANYGKEGNLQNFSSTDDSRYTVAGRELPHNWLVRLGIDSAIFCDKWGCWIDAIWPHKNFWIERASHFSATHHPPPSTPIGVLVVMTTLWNMLSNIVGNSIS